MGLGAWGVDDSFLKVMVEKGKFFRDCVGEIDLYFIVIVKRKVKKRIWYVPSYSILIFFCFVFFITKLKESPYT